MRLRHMETVDFRINEAENFNAILKKYKLQLGPDDVVLMMSQSRNQLVFMHRNKILDLSKFGKRQGEATVYHSQRLRLSNSTWDALMLQNYANKVGIQLDYLRRFEDIMAEREREKTGGGKVLKMSDARDKKTKSKAAHGKRAAA